MKRTLTITSIVALLALSGCATAEVAQPPEPTVSQSSSPPTQTVTPTPVRTPERVEFAAGSIVFADLVAIAERGDVPVILLPASLDAAVVLVGAPDDWFTDSFLRVFPNGDGNITIKPQARYDAFATPQDFVGEASGTITFKTAEGDITVEVEGVEP